jgi:hypothetical protein
MVEGMENVNHTLRSVIAYAKGDPEKHSSRPTWKSRGPPRRMLTPYDDHVNKLIYDTIVLRNFFDKNGHCDMPSELAGNVVAVNLILSTVLATATTRDAADTVIDAAISGAMRRADLQTLEPVPVCDAVLDPRHFHDVVQAAFTDNLISSEAQAEPRSLAEAERRPDGERAAWRQAAIVEFLAHVDNGTWVLQRRRPGMSVLTGKWVLRLKYNPQDGSIERYKARWVARGFLQKFGVDFTATTAPVSQFTTTRAMLAASVEHGFVAPHAFDVKVAYLNADVKGDTILVEQPHGFQLRDTDGTPLVCRLRKSLYGTRQAARNWYRTADEFMLADGFKRSTVDPCLYLAYDQHGALIGMVSLYVDDGLIVGKSTPWILAFKKRLHARFPITDHGEISSLFGIDIKLDNVKRTIDMVQTRYINELVSRFGLGSDAAKTCAVAMPVNKALTKKDCPVSEQDVADMRDDSKLYRQLVGALLWLATQTRPDISFAVSELCKMMHNPGRRHFEAAKHVLRYLKGTSHIGIRFTGGTSTPNVLSTHADASWAGDIDGRRSTTGYISFLNGGPISWRAAQQPIVALSSTEAEYIAVCAAATEVTYLRQLLNDMGIQQTDPTIIRQDNQATIAMSDHVTSFTRTRHIDVKYHYVREATERKIVELRFVPSKEMWADGLTKALHKQPFELSRDRMHGYRALT